MVLLPTAAAVVIAAIYMWATSAASKHKTTTVLRNSFVFGVIVFVMLHLVNSKTLSSVSYGYGSSDKFIVRPATF